MRGLCLLSFCLALTACDLLSQADRTSPLTTTMACVDALAKNQGRRVRDILVVNTETTAKGTQASLRIGEGGALWRCRTDATGAVTTLERCNVAHLRRDAAFFRIPSMDRVRHL